MLIVKEKLKAVGGKGDVADPHSMDIGQNVRLFLGLFVTGGDGSHAPSAGVETGVVDQHINGIAGGLETLFHAGGVFALFIQHDGFGEIIFGKTQSFDLMFQHRGVKLLFACPAQDFIKGGDDAVGDIFGTHEFDDFAAVKGNILVDHTVDGGTGHGIFHIGFHKLPVLEHVASFFRIFVVELPGRKIPCRGGLGDDADLSAVSGGELFTDIVPETCVICPRRFAGLGRTGHIDDGA